MLIILYKNSYKIHEHLPVKLYKDLFVIKIVSICMMDEPGGFIHMMYLKEWKKGLERHKGEKWLVKGKIKIWSGRIWHCEHNKRKERCTTCGGGSICEHNRLRSYCRECGGGSICEHGKKKYYCKECGSSYCEHNREKHLCIQCGGSSICEHGKRKRLCIQCGGSSICEHGKRRSYCRECHGSSICEHNRRRSRCVQCEGSAICRICKSKYGNRKYDKLCITCAIQEGYTVYRNYKTKELSIVEFITQHTNVDWVNDKTYDLGCSNKRPDMVCDLGSHILIIECDENKHKNGDYSCENKRIMELSRDFSENNIHRPIVVIRFNPDTYIDSNNQKIESCWKAGKDGILRIKNKQHWDLRLNKLLETTHHYIDNQPVKDVNFEYLFYDEFEKTDVRL